MSKSVLTGVILFVVGVVAGRASVLLTTPSPTVPPSTSLPALTAAPSRAEPGGTLSGRVAEVIQVPQYTYVRLESGEWAAFDSAPQVTVGAQVSLHLQNEMTDFTSPSLGRTFARLWFASLEGAPPVMKGGPPAVVAAPAEAPAAAVKDALTAVENASALSMRVADVFTERALLGGRRVRVAGKVDRVNVVQGVHYVHLKDGSGTAAEKNDDLLCISSDAVAAGDAVACEGTVAVDKNVGMGVNPVVIDGAKVSPRAP